MSGRHRCFLPLIPVRKKTLFRVFSPSAVSESAKRRRARIRQTKEGCHNREKSLPPQKPRCRLQKSCQPASPCASLSSLFFKRTQAKRLRPRCLHPSPTDPLLRAAPLPLPKPPAGPSRNHDHAGLAPSPALRPRTSPHHAADAPAPAIDPPERR